MLKKLPYDKEKKTKFQRAQAWYTYFKKRHSSRKRPRFLLSNYIKLKNIPFSYIYREFNTFFLERYKTKQFQKVYFGFERYVGRLKIFNRLYSVLKKSIIDFRIYTPFEKDRIFFFKKYYRNFLGSQEDLMWKNKVPSLLITEMRVQRMPVVTTIDKNLNDFISMSHTDEMHQYAHYKDLARKVA